MQKRYCSCGQAIFVEYMFSGSFCSTRFKTEEFTAAEKNAHKISDVFECPHCRSYLTINTLF